ncbi:N-acetyltransferase [Agromyces luteolus]|uniref:GNAT family N-acetyltransferase n=1 Tax=Agromyces luteolus TaxID=88373 RepID=A0A7C9LY19_9MICO|nr:GNAT family N-acetyltransferase [Agromyces luteolus]MUN07257.1 GNAT family N-acetyltransferase [Agromyces luteolus]GLK28512.1 N-acetyltransferase [Agromyces luteolus]
MTVTIRPATSGDAEALARLAAVTFPLACPPSTTADAIAWFIAEQLSEVRFAEYLVDPDRTILVAEPDRASGAGIALAESEAVAATGGLVGWSMLVSTEDGVPADEDAASSVTTRPAIELSKMYVHPVAHGAGIAGSLMAATLAAAAATGAAVVWLGVNLENGRAIRFYEKQGFEVVGTKGFRLGDRVEHDHVLERSL